jgi:DNA polymerase-1
LIGLKQIAKEGVEADDLIYSVAREQSAEVTVVIISSDKDMLQALAAKKVVIFDPFKDVFVTRADAEKNLGFSVERLSLFYGLVGDSSDNIPGVAGIGKKTAQDLASNFQSMDDLYSNVESPLISARVKQLLLADREHAFLSRDLFVLRNDPLQISQQ